MAKKPNPRPRHEMTEVIRQALTTENLMADYLARPAYQRNDYIGWIEAAKRPDTKTRRIQQMLDELRAGGVYMKMAHRASVKQ